MQTELSIEVDRPVSHVFCHALDDVTQWSKTCVEREILEETPEKVGTRFRLVTEERGRKMEFQGIVTEHEEDKRSRIALTGPAFDLDVLYLFEDLGGTRTRVTQRSEVTGKGCFKPMLWLMGFLMKKASCNAQQVELEAMKAWCESQPAD